MSFNQYVKTVVCGTQLQEDTGNRYLYIAARPYAGKPEKGLAPGAIVTLQILEDNAPTIDKKTGKTVDNRLEPLTVTVVGCQYPLPFEKGDEVSLGNFMPEHSYYIDYQFILRYDAIHPYKPPTAGGSKDAAGKS